jgi:hypothetical protein
LNVVSSLITDVAALVLTVNIEGMIKNYFSDERFPSEDVVSDVKTSIDIVNRSGFPDYTKVRIITSLGNMAKLSVSNILKVLVVEGLIDSDQVKSWNKLRNSVAHADNLANDRSAIERFVDDIGNCTSLFYRLIGLSVGYDVDLVVANEHEKLGGSEEAVIG